MTLTPDYTIADNGLPSILNRRHTNTNYKGERLNNNSATSNPEHHYCWNASQSKKLLPKRGSKDTHSHWAHVRVINNVSQTTSPSNVILNYQQQQPSHAESYRNGQSGTTNSAVWINQTGTHRNNLRGMAPRGLDKSEKERLNHMRKNQT